jgi:hypothetical protein
MATLPELLRLQGGAFVGYPQMPNKTVPQPQGGYAEGFLSSAAGFPQQPNMSVLDPNAAAYLEGRQAGEPVNIAAMAAPAAILANTLRRTPKTVAPALDEIGMRLQTRLDKDYPSLVEQYKALKDSQGGKVLNTDIARELSEDYLKNRTLSANVHEPASTFIKRYYADLLAKPAQPNASVLFTGGGTGAGKTSSLGETLPNVARQAEIVYDTNMNKLESARKKIDQALEAGRKVDLVYTYRDPVEALRLGSLSRAMHQIADFGTGRTVPLKEHIRTHTGSKEVMPQLMDIYKDNPNVRMAVVDNSLGKGQARISTLEGLPKLDTKSLEKQLRNALEEEFKAGKITKEVYEASK